MALIKYTQARLAGDRLITGIEAQPPVPRHIVEDLARVARLQVEFHTLDGKDGPREVMAISDSHNGYVQDSMFRLALLASRVGVESARAEGRTDEVYDTVRDDSLVRFVDSQYGSGSYERGLAFDPRLNTGAEQQFMFNRELVVAGLGDLVAHTVRAL